ncbi:MAG: biopolymer transporter ExbD [Bdellovibrionota bacterium]
MAKQELNTELNLTSMIDLMSCLVAFMLLTSVWVHVAALPAAVESKGRAPQSVDKPKEPNEIKITVTKTGVKLAWPNVKGVRLPAFVRRGSEGFDHDTLSDAIAQALEVKELTASVTGTNDVEYGAVAEAIDAVKAGGLDQVFLLTN